MTRFDVVASFTVATLALASTPRAARAETKDEALARLGERVQLVRGEIMNRQQATDTFAAAMSCVEAVGPIKAAGGGGGDQVPLPEHWRYMSGVEQLEIDEQRDGSVIVTVTVWGARQWCVTWAQEAAVYLVQADIGELAQWRGLDPAVAAHASRAQDLAALAAGCHERIEVARAAGVPDDRTLAYSELTADRRSLPAKVTLGAAEAKICAPAGKRAAEVLAAAKGRADATLAPWHAVLSGDKRTVFDERFTGAYARGRGGVRLDTPDAMAKADVWFGTWTVRTLPDGATEYRVVRWEFKKMKLKRPPTTRIVSARGDLPASAYR